MIDEQDVFFARISRWEELGNFYDIHSLGVNDWLNPIEALMKPIDFKSKSLLEIIAGYMESNGDGSHARLLRRSLQRLLIDCRKLAAEALKVSRNKKELHQVMVFGGELWQMSDFVRQEYSAIAGMASSYRDDKCETGSFADAARHLEKINCDDDSEPIELSPKSNNRNDEITRKDLLRMYNIKSQTLDYRIKNMGHPKPSRIEGRKQWFCAKIVDEWRAKQQKRT